MKRKAVLPTWATAISAGKIEIDAAKFYPEILEELWVDEDWPVPLEPTEEGAEPTYADNDKMYQGLQREEIDQYWLEVALQVAKRDLQVAINNTDLMPAKGSALVIIVKDGTKASNKSGVSTYAQSAYLPGRGVEKATKGKEARGHYDRIRGVLF